MKEFVKNCEVGGGTLGSSGGSEDKKVGRYAGIGERSSHGICHCEGVKRPSQSQNGEVLSVINLTPPLSLKRRGRTPSRNEFIYLFTYSLKKKAAFTLAEVLITLGIIGVVAAMTMPTLIAKHRAQVLQTQFKKRYSEVSQALVQLKKNDEFLNVTDGPQLQDLLVQQFKEAKAPARNIYTSTPERQKELLGFELPVYKTLDKNSEYYERALDDGFIFINNEYFVFINADYSSLNNASIIIDINALKGPNIAGYDLFFFNLDENFILRSTDKIDYLCNKKTSGNQSGYSCSYYAMTDKDYFKNLGW